MRTYVECVATEKNSEAKNIFCIAGLDWIFFKDEQSLYFIYISMIANESCPQLFLKVWINT